MGPEQVQRFIETALADNPHERPDSLALRIVDELDLLIVPWLYDRRIDLLGALLATKEVAV